MGPLYAAYIRHIPDSRPDSIRDIELDAGFHFTSSKAARLGTWLNVRFILDKWRV